MSKTIHDENCDCVVCSNDLLGDLLDQSRKEICQLKAQLAEERRCNTALSEYKSAKDALLDVARIRQETAKQCIELGDAKAIRDEFGI